MSAVNFAHVDKTKPWKLKVIYVSLTAGYGHCDGTVFRRLNNMIINSLYELGEVQEQEVQEVLSSPNFIPARFTVPGV
jgi:hypothetical protein